MSRGIYGGRMFLVQTKQVLQVFKDRPLDKYDFVDSGLTENTSPSIRRLFASD